TPTNREAEDTTAVAPLPGPTARAPRSQTCLLRSSRPTRASRGLQRAEARHTDVFAALRMLGVNSWVQSVRSASLAPRDCPRRRNDPIPATPGLSAGSASTRLAGESAPPRAGGRTRRDLLKSHIFQKASGFSPLPD